MKVWTVEYREQVSPYQSMIMAVCSTRDKAIEWIVKYGKENLDHDSDYYAIEHFEMDPTHDDDFLNSPEFFLPDGSPMPIG